jgi:hypothetical protein
MGFLQTPARRYFLAFLGMLFIFIPCAFLTYPSFDNTDGCEHTAAARELTYSFTKPHNPLLNLPGNTSPRFVPSVLLMAIVQKIFSPGLFTLVGFSSIASFLLLGVGIYLFSKEYFHDERQPLYTFLCILFLWGKGWDESNSYMFSSLIPFAYYPSVISFTLIPLSLFFLLRYLHEGKRRHSSVFVALSSLILLNHPVTGLLYFFVTLVLMIMEGYGQKKNLFFFTLTFLIAFGLTALWPYYPFFKSLFFVASGKAKQFWDYGSTHAYLYSNLLKRVGPAFLGVIPLLYFGLKRQYPFIVYGFLSCLLFYALGYFLDISLGERFVFFCLFFSQLAFSRLLKILIEERTIFKNALVVNLAATLFLCTLGAGTVNQLVMMGKVYLPQLAGLNGGVYLKKYRNPMEKYIVLQNYLHRGDTVLADVFTSWPRPCITGVKVVSLYHNSPLIPENAERLSDTVTFFRSPNERTRIVEKYHVSHVLLNKKLFPPSRVEDQAPQFFIPYPDERFLHEMTSLGDTIINDEHFLLVKVNTIRKENHNLSANIQLSEISEKVENRIPSAN